MSNAPEQSNRRSFLAECASILYWAFFKPYTFRRWLREIDPDLDIDTNPFSLRERFGANPRLRRYANQVWLISAFAPAPVIPLAGLTYPLMSSELSLWTYSLLPLFGWWAGLVIVRLGRDAWVVSLFVDAVIIFILALLIFSVLWETRWLPEPIIAALQQIIDTLVLARESRSPAIAEAGAAISGIIGSVVVFRFFGAVSIAVVVGVTVGMLGGVSILLIGFVSLIAVAVSRTFRSDARVVIITVAGMFGGAVIGGLLGGAPGNVLGGMIGGAFGSASGSVSTSMPGTLYIGLAVGAFVGIAGSVSSGNVLSGLVSGGIISSIFIAGPLRLPFWLVELPWMLLIALRARSDQDAARLLAWLPPRFDEVIILPLPFLDDVIARAYRANQAAARATLDYLITSTNQQEAAGRAIVAIAIDALERCATVDAIGAIADDLAWIPNPPPKELGRLPDFLEIAQDVRAAVQATSLSRQRELLAVPLRRLTQLREGMAFDATQAARFGAAVDRWQAALEVAIRALDERIGQTGEIPQVYIAGPPLDPDRAGMRFKGRVDVFREIETLALAPQHPTLLLHGGRRIGKTSTLNYLPRRVGSDIVPLFVDAQGLAVAQTMSGLAREMARQMIESARRARNLSLPQADDAAFERDPFAQLLEWMRRVERACEDRTLLLCLDEFEKLEEIIQTSNTRAPLDFLRHVMQHRPRWTLLFAGTRALEELSPLWSDCLIHARAIRLSFLHEADARELITQPVADFPDIYDPAAVECIIRKTRCQPYLVQLVCTEIVNLLNRERRRRAVAADVDAAIVEAFERGAQYFREFWQNLSDHERRALRTLAHAGAPPDDASPALLNALVRREVLRAADGTYAFQVPMVRRWVRERSETADPPSSPA